MSFKSRYERDEQEEKKTHSEQETDVTKAQRENSKYIKREAIKTPKQYQNIQEQGKGFFYILLLIQALIILGSYYLQMEHFYYDATDGAQSNSAAFKEYCKNTNYCQKFIQKDGNKSEMYKIVNYWPNQLHWISLIAYPLVLMFQYFIRDISFLRKIAFLFTFISYPCLFLFVQIISVYIRNYFEYYIEYLQAVFWIYLAFVVFFILNQFVLEIKNQENQKLTYLIFLAFIVNFLYNTLFQTSANWTFYILTIVYIHTYFNHIDANLFQHNKYNEKNKALIRIIFNKLLKPLKVKVDRNQFNNHIVLNKRFTIFYAIIIILAYQLVSLFQQEQTVIILSSIILIFVYLDTSLVSTTTFFTSDDQWLAANLFFLDFLLPIRNILMVLFLD
ncbi:unnamed protein product [Paramecium octaurelia]|uniref:Transmembrane protein n=1 Tax=Paramecium octaurelia TaxID=43137 RepID=A0A8S1TKQ0_PAROT|nr:unnamed protein product [Paramecium octaurelia]